MGDETTPMISCRGVWKVFGPRAERIVGSADADLPRAELEARTGCVAAVRDVSFDVVDDRLTTMRFELTKPTDMTVDCTVIAQETNHGVVGRTVVTVGPTQTPSTVHEVQIKTTTLAVIGTVRTCAERTG